MQLTLALVSIKKWWPELESVKNNRRLSVWPAVFVPVSGRLGSFPNFTGRLTLFSLEFLQGGWHFLVVPAEIAVIIVSGGRQLSPPSPWARWSWIPVLQAVKSSSHRGGELIQLLSEILKLSSKVCCRVVDCGDCRCRWYLHYVISNWSKLRSAAEGVNTIAGQAVAGIALS